jgi:16S rRNA (guanine966-N2)-methyltransferase
MRIIGGTYGSRPLVAPRGRATRPTSDRVREALFGILESAKVVDNARIIDLYAGTGALGLEALSRGAAHATFVESSREALDAIRTNVATLGVADRTKVVAGDVLRAVRALAPAVPFDLVLADPPWALVDDGVAIAALGALLSARAVGPRTWIVLEHSARTTPAVTGGGAGLTPFDTRRYGDTALTFYKPDILVRLSS